MRRRSGTPGRRRAVNQSATPSNTVKTPESAIRRSTGGSNRNERIRGLRKRPTFRSCRLDPSQKRFPCGRGSTASRRTGETELPGRREWSERGASGRAQRARHRVELRERDEKLISRVRRLRCRQTVLQVGSILQPLRSVLRAAMGVEPNSNEP